MASYSDPRKN